MRANELTMVQALAWRSTPDHQQRQYKRSVALWFLPHRDDNQNQRSQSVTLNGWSDYYRREFSILQRGAAMRVYVTFVLCSICILAGACGNSLPLASSLSVAITPVLRKK